MYQHTTLFTEARGSGVLARVGFASETLERRGTTRREPAPPRAVVRGHHARWRSESARNLSSFLLGPPMTSTSPSWRTVSPLGMVPPDSLRSSAKTVRPLLR